MVLKKVLFVGLVVCTLFSVAHAQNLEGVNARLDALGGEGISDDIGWTYMQPRNYIKFPNYVQGNIIIKEFWGTAECFGRLFFTKSIGDRVVVGGTLNNSPIMGGDFYYRAFNFLGTDDLILDVLSFNNYTLPSFPQIGANIKVADNINIGVLGFLERIKSDNEYKIGGVDSTRTKKYTHPGFVVDANIGLGNFFLAPRFRIGFPKITGEVKSVHADKSIYNQTYDSETGLYLHFGTAAGYVGLKHPIIFGYFFNRENYQFSTVEKIPGADDVTLKTMPVSDNTSVLFIGTEVHFGDGFKFVPELDVIFSRYRRNGLGDWSWVSNSNDTLALDTLDARNILKFRFAVEKKIELSWFDLTPRAGFVYTYVKYRQEFTDSLDNQDVIHNPTVTNQDKFGQNKGMKVTAGFGLAKRRLQLDISADLVKWDGGTVFTGPTAGMLSLTIDIAKTPRYKSNKNEDQAPPAFDSPAPTEEEEPESEAPYGDLEF